MTAAWAWAATRLGGLVDLFRVCPLSIPEPRSIDDLHEIQSGQPHRPNCRAHPSHIICSDSLLGPFPVARLECPGVVDENSRQVADARDIGSEPKLETAGPVWTRSRAVSTPVCLACRPGQRQSWKISTVADCLLALIGWLSSLLVCLSSMHHMSMCLAAKQTHGIIPNVRPLIACLPCFPEKRPCRGKQDTITTITTTTAWKLFKAMNLQVLDFVGTACVSRRAWNLRMDSQKGKTLPRLQMYHQAPHPKKTTGTTAACPNPKPCSQPKSQKTDIVLPKTPQMSRES